MWIHLVPVLLGSGTPMFEDLGDRQIALEIVEVIEGAAATHLHFPVADRDT
jgi:hypothetical protein